MCVGFIRIFRLSMWPSFLSTSHGSSILAFFKSALSHRRPDSAEVPLGNKRNSETNEALCFLNIRFPNNASQITKVDHMKLAGDGMQF
jgi:hypothetical protein